MRPDIKMESLFKGLSIIWDRYCPVFSADVKCTFQYITSWHGWWCLSVSRCMCFCVWASGVMASVIRFVLQLFCPLQLSGSLDSCLFLYMYVPSIVVSTCLSGLNLALKAWNPCVKAETCGRRTVFVNTPYFPHEDTLNIITAVFDLLANMYQPSLLNPLVDTLDVCKWVNGTTFLFTFQLFVNLQKSVTRIWAPQTQPGYILSIAVLSESTPACVFGVSLLPFIWYYGAHDSCYYPAVCWQPIS